MSKSLVKICGLFRECDADYVNEAMPDFAGFVFAKSRRQVDEKMAEKLRTKLNPSIRCVGVFVNVAVQTIVRYYESGIIQLAQLHGTENQAYIDELKEKCDIPIIKAINMDIFDVKMLVSADYYLLDKGTGGTGKSFDWSRIPKLPKPYFLAGGINHLNIEEALKTEPYAIDVSSGVETDKVKDKKKIIEIVNAIRQ